MVSVATLAAFKAAVPRTTVPARNVTVPVTVPPPVPLTVAVKVTGCP